MKNCKFKQKGVVLLLLLLVFLVGGSAMMLGTLNNRQDAYMRQQAELSEQMRMAKEALLAFAANFSAIYDNERGPGFFPCPETMDPVTGIADEDCSGSSVYLGRLPKYIEVQAGNKKIFFNSYYAGVNQQFWYAVAPHYIYSTDADDRRAVNRTSTDSTARLSVDGTDNIVALIIAPGEALSSQDRDANYFASNFLEGGNEDMDSDFFTTDAINPDTFNDRIIAITHDELMAYIGTDVAVEIKGVLDEYYDNQAEPQHYPGDSIQRPEDYRADFMALFADHDWLDDMEPYYEQWVDNTIYEAKSATEASLVFGGCAMSFTLKRDGGVVRNGNSC